MISLLFELNWMTLRVYMYIHFVIIPPPTFYVQSLIKRAHYALSIGHNEDTELFSLPVLNWISMTLFRFELQLTYMVQKLLLTFKHPNIVYINNYIELYINTNIDLLKKKPEKQLHLLSCGSSYIYIMWTHYKETG